MHTTLRRSLVLGTSLTLLSAPVLAAGVGTARAEAVGAVISNGTVSLGVNANGQLIHDPGSGLVGLQYVPTGNDGLRAGSPNDGWGAGNGDPGDPFEAGAHEAFFAGPSAGAVNDSFGATPTTATAVTTVQGRLRVTHDFFPAPETPLLYAVVVTLENVGATPIADVRYTRTVEWDAEPTAFNEFLTIQRGSTPAPGGPLLYSSDAYADPRPLQSRTAFDLATENTDFVDNGPKDQSTMFDLGLGSLARGEALSFTMYYGAAPTEAAADAAVAAVSMDLYSYGQPNRDDSATTGEPNTFIWGFSTGTDGPTPVVPEVPLPAVLPLLGGLMAAAWMVRRRSLA